MDYTTTLTEHDPIAITIGNFDGIHKGHLRLMQELRSMAHALEAKPVLVTFDPHTLLVVRPGINLQCLTTMEEKLALTARYGHISDAIIIKFTPQVAQMSANEFLESIRSRFRLRGMVIGLDFSLGHNRMGNIEFLQEYGQKHAIEVLPIQLEAAEQARISSTRIRTLVTEGQIAEANALLGHPVIASSIVVKGDQRGRMLGFPTANLQPESHKLLPADGVYAAQARLGDVLQGDEKDNSPVYNSVVNIGVRPTFGGHKRIVEAHLLDVDLDLYDQRITLDFIERLRNEQRFANIEALKSQIASDVQTARQVLQKET
ncbi:MAG TPA: bifunctional riboflavin kinase/FAD synthetase [Ktedonobacteraceae bacterium]|nr:bifunctional riboflavin kinase/FAD synthetase [Ktedonobacteraceae bacterium]